MGYGFRPYRNRNNPGDAPPKWGLSKTGCIVIVLTVIAGIVIALMVIGTRSGDASDDAASPAASQSPEPPPWFGGRVEMPEHGFAVTLPDDWVAFDTAVDAVSQLEAASDVLDPVWSVDEAAFVDMLADRASHGIQLWSAHASSVSNCLLSAVPVSAMPADDVAVGMFERFVDDPAARDVEPPSRVDLLVGASYHVRMSKRMGPVEAWVSSSTYFLPMGEGILAVVCTTPDDPPDDDWLSIAETIEFLPAEE